MYSGKFARLVTFVEVIMEVTLLRSTRDYPMLAFRGYNYRFQSVSATGLRRWRCPRKACKGKLTTQGEEDNPQETAAHEHPPNPEEVQVKYPLDNTF